MSVQASVVIDECISNLAISNTSSRDKVKGVLGLSKVVNIR